MTVELFEQSVGNVDAVLANLSAADFEAASPCAAWTVRDVVKHITDGTEFFASAIATGTPGGTDVEVTPEGARDAYAAGAQRAISAFAAPGAMEKIVQMPFGEMPGSALVLIAATDHFQHAWDIAKATGQSTDIDPALAEQLLGFAHAAIQDSFRGPEGQAPFGALVEAPASATAADRLAAFLGRQP